MIPFLIVSATRAPTSTAPRNSQIAAARQACFMVSDLELTLVAKELKRVGIRHDNKGIVVITHLATSLAPMLNASRAAYKIDTINIVSRYTSNCPLTYEYGTKGEEIIPLVKGGHRYECPVVGRRGGGGGCLSMENNKPRNSMLFIYGAVRPTYGQSFSFANIN
jgi:hypothetical protein